ncbi:MAG: ABC transporter substrate-binding protein [Gaiellaceae bacterium]
MTRKLKFLLFALVLVLALGAASCGGDADEAAPEEGGATGGTLVFGTASDPVVLDGALVSDGESLRVIDQLFEGLVTLEPGTTEVIPALATDWESSEDGLEWTFNLREGVSFHDGEPFNADAVCFNFDRWYNFPASFQNANASYYWQYGFGGGFADPIEGAAGPEDSIYNSCQAVDDLTVTLVLNRSSAAFLPALSLPSLAFHSPKALQEFGADEGEVDEEGIFRPTGTYGTEHPTGTGPFKFESWVRGDRLTVVRNDEYWGEQAKLDGVVFRPIPDNAARLQALQAGDIQGFDLVEPQDMPTIEGDPNLQLLRRPAFNVGYVGINQGLPPMDQLAVRQAVAHGLDRQGVVTDFYPPGAEVAKEFMPPQLFGYADDVTEYEFDPELSKQLLEEAGLTLPVEIEFWYPTDVSRPYMPDPKRNFEAFRASLEQSGFKVTPRSAPWSPDYLGAVDAGQTQLYLLGWTGDYGDPDNFVGTFFQTQQPAWGTDKQPDQAIIDALDAAEAEPDLAARTAAYEEANRLIMDWLPGIPYVHTQPALAFAANVTGYVPSPISLEPFSLVSIEE